jgi:hypothetical protein
MRAASTGVGATSKMGVVAVERTGEVKMDAGALGRV